MRAYKDDTFSPIHIIIENNEEACTVLRALYNFAMGIPIKRDDDDIYKRMAADMHSIIKDARQ